MAKKKGSTGKSKGNKVLEDSVPCPTPRVSVDIKKAKNGFVVSQWGDKGETTYVAKDQKEANQYVAKLLKIKE